ncbi:MAG: hypothetical protein AAF941_00270 [Pseudomonadota bacterium]
MKGITRRGALGSAMAVAVAGLAGQAVPAGAARPSIIPSQPMKLARRIERGMRGGAILTVERFWQVRFARQGDGIVITGEQISARVDAPQALAALAHIEESRSTTGMFPILLSGDGSILAAGDYIQGSDLDAAVGQAETMIAKRAVPQDAKAQLLYYLSQLQRSSTTLLDRMPPDLFFPISPPSRAVRPVSLPDGLMGEFEVTYEARPAPGCDWLDRAVRRVITRIGNSERRSSEVWLLTDI